MIWRMKAPDETVPFRTLLQILAAKPAGVFSVSPTDTARAALEVMAERRVGFLVVLEGGRLAGVISERDYTRKLVPSGRSAEQARVAELMTREVISVTPVSYTHLTLPTSDLV